MRKPRVRHFFYSFVALMLFAIVSSSQTTSSGSQDSPSSPAALVPQATPAGETSAGKPGQQPGSQTRAVYESATVLKAVTRLVVLDVVATDKKGDAITDLERADFTVSEDGKEQKITVFNLQKPAATDASANTEPNLKPVSLPENVFTNMPRFKISSALNVLLLDGLNTTLPNQGYVRDQMIKYLEKMPADRPVAVYILGSKLTLLQDFTSDPAVLMEVVKKLRANASPLLDSAIGNQSEVVFPPGALDGAFGTEVGPEQTLRLGLLEMMMKFEQERSSFQTDLRVRYTLAALTSLARGLSGYPGRKNLIWLSEAFPLNIDPNMELTDKFAGTRNYNEQIAEAANQLIDSQIAIYPVDARGLATPALFNVANKNRDQFGRPIFGPGLGKNLSDESASLQAAHDAMQEMAERTGGKAFYNRNDLDGAIKKSIEDGSTYYTLAYYPQNKNWNGQFRKIQVKTKRPGVKLRTRLGYFAVNPTIFAERDRKQQEAAFSDALSLDYPVSTGLLFEAGVLQPSPQTANKVLVNFGIDPHALSFEKQGDGLQHATVDCVVRAYTVKGDVLKTETSTITAALKPGTFAQIMQNTFPCQQSIDLAAGSYVLRLGVRDRRTGLTGTANATVTVAADAPPAAAKDGASKP